MLLYRHLLQKIKDSSPYDSSSTTYVYPSSDKCSDQSLFLSNAALGGFTQRIMACSTTTTSASGNQMHRDLIYNGNHRPLCNDRRGFFDHLRPRTFVKNTVRVVLMQSTTAVTNYYNVQLKEDVDREERVQRGEITRAVANKEDEEWQEREWNRRMEALPQKIMVAYLKYHAVVLVMRLYEYIASQYVDDKTLDKLTMDTFEAARRSARAGKDDLAREMLRVNWNAGIISYLADYSVHQVILTYGYYLYVQEQRRKLKYASGNNKIGGGYSGGAVFLSFMEKSTMLALSRGVGLCFSSIGGAVGSTVWPGWGTLAGSNFGDSFALSVMEDVDPPTA